MLIQVSETYKPFSEEEEVCLLFKYAAMVSRKSLLTF